MPPAVTVVGFSRGWSGDLPCEIATPVGIAGPTRMMWEDYPGSSKYSTVSVETYNAAVSDDLIAAFSTPFTTREQVWILVLRQDYTDRSTFKDRLLNTGGVVLWEERNGTLAFVLDRIGVGAITTEQVRLIATKKPEAYARAMLIAHSTGNQRWCLEKITRALREAGDEERAKALAEKML